MERIVKPPAPASFSATPPKGIAPLWWPGLAVFSPGNMAAVKWTAAVYFDDSASDSQKEALMQIFTGQAGGHPGRLVLHIGDVLGVSSLPMTYQADGKRRSLKIEGVAEAEIEALATGQGGADITVENHPLCIAPGYKAVVSKSKQVSYQDHGQLALFREERLLFAVCLPRRVVPCL